MSKVPHSRASGDGLDVDAIRALLRTAKSEGRNLFEHEAYQVLSLCGLEVPTHRFVTSPQRAESALQAIGGPVVMKIVSRDILHKSDVGGVILGVSSAEQCGDAWARLRRAAESCRARFDGVIVASQAMPGLEIIVGATRDQEFGPVAMIGPGGVLVEILRSPTFFIAPAEAEDILPVLSQGFLGRLLGGVRGGKALDKESLARIVSAVSRLIYGFPEVSEIDLNPVAPCPKGCGILDARIMLA